MLARVYTSVAHYAPRLQAATPAQVEAAAAEGAARLKACTTEECRTVINALNAKKMSKLTGACGRGGLEGRRLGRGYRAN